MSWLQIHVCNPCGLWAPSFKFASSLISAKWRFFFLLPQLGRYREEGSHCIQWEPSIFIFYSRVTSSPPQHINAATLTITSAFMCPSQRSLGKEGQLLIIKRYLFGSCGALNSSYTWHSVILATQDTIPSATQYKHIATDTVSALFSLLLLWF